MTSLFDSNVYERRKHTPWAEVNLEDFMRDMAVSTIDFKKVTLTCHYRHSVASRYWWAIEWTDESGVEHLAEAQELNLCLWRAAQMELQARERQKREALKDEA